MNWNQFPFVRILLPFVIGIVTAMHFENPQVWMSYVLALLIVCYVLLILLLFKRISYSKRWISGLFINGILFLVAYQVTILNSSYKLDFLKDTPQDLSLVLMLEDDPVEKENSFKLLGRLQAFKNNMLWCSKDHKILMYFQKSEAVKDLRYGDLLMVNSIVSKTKNPGNPGEFDYKKYLKNHGINVQCYVKKDQWVKLDSSKGNTIVAQSKRVRRQLLNILQSNGIKGKELGVASALLLGYDEFLEPDQKSQYSGAGAMHILCVSGLHVGIITMILNVLLKFLNRKRVLRVVKLVLMILFIWAYAAITGFSPSVLRASTMFSFIVIGLTFKRSVSIYNMLAASAFLLLLLDPGMIALVGFQLSYLAVFGIVLLYKPISQVFVFGNLLLDRTWQITAVSISATLATFPLSIYYFNQFPNLFLITNIIVIPLSFLIVYCGIFLLVSSIFPVISSLIARVLNLLLNGLNSAVEFIQGIPYATSQNIYLTFTELILLFGILLFIISMVFAKRKSSLFISLCLGVLLLLSFSLRKHKQLSQSGFVVYNIGGHTALEFVCGRESVLLCDSSLLLQPQKISYATKGNSISLGIKNTLFFTISEDVIQLPWIRKQGPFVRFMDRTMFLPDEQMFFSMDSSLPAKTTILISQKKGITPEIWKEFFSSYAFILDSSLPPWETKAWNIAASEGSFNFFDVSDMGAYIEGFD